MHFQMFRQFCHFWFQSSSKAWVNIQSIDNPKLCLQNRTLQKHEASSLRLLVRVAPPYIGSITNSTENRRCKLWAVVFIIATYFYNAQQRAQKTKLSWCECEKYKWLDCSQRNVRRSGYLSVYLLQTRQTESKCVSWGELTFDEKSLHTQSAYEWWDFCTLGIHSQRRSSIYL